MQRSFKPRKQGQYLPGEPNMLVMVYQLAFHPVKVTERVRIPLANPNFITIPRLRGRTARQTAATRPMWVRIPPESHAPFVQQPGLLASNEGTPGRHRDGAPIFCPRSPTAEATRRDRVQCGCNSCRGHQISIRGLSLKVERLSYKEVAGERYLQPLSRHWSNSKMPARQAGDPGAEPGCRTIFRRSLIDTRCSLHGLLSRWHHSRGVEPRGATPPPGASQFFLTLS
jgi:hypothetical protein